MKNTIFSFAFLAAISPLALSAKPGNFVSVQAQEAISNDFPSAEDLTWGNDQQGVVTAYFNQYGNREVAQVDEDGNLLSVLTYYTLDNVPARVRYLLTEKFPGKTIESVVRYEVTNAGPDDQGIPNVSYQANLSDATHFYVVKVSGSDVVTKQVLDKD